MLERMGRNPEKRIGKTPCEASIGCPKGHYKDRPDLDSGEEAVLVLWRSQESLTKAERQDDFLCGAFAALSEQKGTIDRVIAMRASSSRSDMGTV